MSSISDLAILKTVNDSTPLVGDNVTFTITATNNGPNSDTGVVVTDSLPSGYSLVSATPLVGSWVAPNWTIGSMAVGTTSMTIVATVLPSGTYDNTATITGVNFDPNLANNTSTQNVTPIPVTFETIQGYITTLDTPTSGTLTDINGDVYDFDDTTLTDRSISLSIGSLIIGSFNSGTNLIGNIVLLQPIFDIINATLTADSFTRTKVKCALQIAQCCAVNKINKYITNQDDGKRNEKLFNDAELMFNMIDSLSKQGLFIPEGDLLIGRQAVYEIIADSTVGAKDVTLTIGDANYSFNSATGTDNDFATDIADHINLLYPQSYPYYAVSSGQNVVIVGIAFDEDNNTAVTGSTTNGTLTLSPPGYLFGGIVPTYQGKNCLTNQEAQTILSKLKSLCGC